MSRLPFEINGPLIKLPINIPTNEMFAIIEVHNMLSCSFHANLATKIGATWFIPKIAQDENHMPNKVLKMYIVNIIFLGWSKSIASPILTESSIC